jgi:hypothetical protein
MIGRAHFAPTELGLVSYCGGYKHSAPTELKAFAAQAAPRNLSPAKAGWQGKGFGAP